MEKLCPSCVSAGLQECAFITTADIIAASFYNKPPDQEAIDRALELHDSIADERIRARNRECPSNTYDPDFPFKNLL